VVGSEVYPAISPPPGKLFTSAASCYSSYRFLIRKALARFAAFGCEHLYRDPSSESNLLTYRPNNFTQPAEVTYQVFWIPGAGARCLGSETNNLVWLEEEKFRFC
jgi:hypothetical protein